MQILNKVSKVTDDSKHLKTWLESEYPHGIDLYYVDYRDSLDDNTDVLMQLVRDGYSEELDNSILDYDLPYTFDQIEKEYVNSFDEINEISDNLRDYIREWCYDHDTSDCQKDLLNNTSKQLLFLDTGVEAYEYNQNIKDLLRRFGKNEAQKKAIEFITNEQMYHSTIQFYFHVDIADLVDVLHRESGEYITINGAMIGNVNRGNGSNWLSDDDIFKIVMTKKAFLQNVYGDREQGTGYGWYQICGDWNRDGAIVASSKTRKRGYTYILGATTDSHKSDQALFVEREREYIAHWDNGKGTCTLGDMNYSRHGSKTYTNNYPCGTHCDKCGTFWID